MAATHTLTFKVDHDARQYSSLIAFGMDTVTAASEMLNPTLPIEQCMDNSCIINNGSCVEPHEP